MGDSNILSKYTPHHLRKKGLLSEPSYECLSGLGHTHLTAVQWLSIPSLLSKENVYLHARTGSGKTLAFLLPTIERLKAMKFTENFGVGALVISPTRELAQQISMVLCPFAEAHNLSAKTYIGGLKIKKKNLNPDAVIVVGTPGCISELLKSKNENPLNVRKLRILILDEADRLLDGGVHMQQIKEIVQKIELDKVQKILVSATVNKDALSLGRNLLKSEFNLISTEKSTNTPSTDQISQQYMFVAEENRLAMLVTILNTLKKKKTIVFFNSCHSVKFHHSMLSCFQLPVSYCMGQDRQSKRSNMYENFHKVKKGILLTTGMAERGWDIPDVHWIIQFDPPHRPEDYIHRVGRTGRGNAKTGKALLFLRQQEIGFLDCIKKFNSSIDNINFNGDMGEINNKVNEVMEENYSIRQEAKIAYKKFVRAYQCHKLKDIFNIQSLNLKLLCKSFGFPTPPMELGVLS